MGRRMASLPQGMKSQFYLTNVIEGFYRQGSQHIGQRVTFLRIHHPKPANAITGSEWTVGDPTNLCWKPLYRKHRLEEHFVQILHGEYIYLYSSCIL